MFDIGERANRQPVTPQIFERQMRLNAFADVARRNAVPDDIREVAGNVIEHTDVNQRFVHKRQERGARTDARADDADALKAFGGKPPDGGARIECGLANRLNRAPDVRADEVIGARQFRRAARFVIRQSQTQGGDAEAREKF